MKMSLRFAAGALLALIMQVVCFAQHYKQTNLVSDTSGVAPVTDPQLVNPWGLSRSSSSPWWISDNATDSVRSTTELEPNSPLSSPIRQPHPITRTHQQVHPPATSHT